MDSSVFTPYLPRLLLDWASEDVRGSVKVLDGSLVFVDISGFTKMSERLARKGKVGSEEVAEVLNSTFTRLINYFPISYHPHIVARRFHYFAKGI